MTCPSCGRVAPARDATFCDRCGSPLASSGDTATSLKSAVPIAALRARQTTEASGRFLPGTIIGTRYRMIGLVGRGGMGEVYRADDLKLGQPVALKFLPPDVERDPDRLDRFLAEVRTSLKVTHPNVCRVFDIGNVDERHYISMEFVDGEDLASLLRRIGRLPEDKAIEIARQLCDGLTAAHDEGVLHRDLKPANILIDGRGRAKIADFGLGAPSGEVSSAEARAGTPQYMAPEQVEGGKLSERTDIYALGLVLYELFTGKRAFEINNLDDLKRLRTSTPTSPTSHVSGLNPLVERAILMCLQPDPAKRPASAESLAKALPGGDPLAMAVAAGDTPSPEMVAAAGSDAGLRVPIATALLVASLVGLVACGLLAGRVSYNTVAAPTKAPAVMVERATEILRSVGFPATFADSGWGFEHNVSYRNRPVADRARDGFDRQIAHAQYFWYRESPVLLERAYFILPYLLTALWDFDPPMFGFSGDVLVRLDREGRLRELVAVPQQRPTTSPRQTDWSPMFGAAGLSLSEWRPDAPQWNPGRYGDERVAWVPAAPREDDLLRVEAASFHGRPVSFLLVYPWTSPYRDEGTERTAAQQTSDLVAVLFVSLIMAAAAIVARRNFRLDRVDRRGAARLAIVMAVLTWLSWVLTEHHVPAIWELYLVILGCGWTLFVAGLLAAFYLALEPYVRRIWPSMIISWSRLMAGAIRDPLVARDVLIGCAVGALSHVLWFAGFFTNGAVTGVLPLLDVSPGPLLGPAGAASTLATVAVFSVFTAFLLLLLLLGLRQLLRREWLAVIAATVVYSAVSALPAPSPAAALPFEIVVNLAIFLLLARVGLVATIAAILAPNILNLFALTWPPNAWYSNIGLAGIALTAALAFAAFRIATKDGRRPQAA